MQLVNFAIFFVILNEVFLKPVGRAIAKRRAYINSLTLDYDRYAQQLRDLAAQAEAKRAAARRDAEASLAKARAAIANETAEIAAHYAASVHETVETAHQTVTSEIESARRGEQSAVRALAELMLQRIIPREVAR